MDNHSVSPKSNSLYVQKSENMQFKHAFYCVVGFTGATPDSNGTVDDMAFLKKTIWLQKGANNKIS
ncbi:hypothetical protein GCM10010203_43410 [Actinomadura yumaensis]